MLVVVGWVQEAFWDCGAAVVVERRRAVGGSSVGFTNNPAAFFVLMDEYDVAAIDGLVVHVNKRSVVVALVEPVLNSNDVASSQGWVCLGGWGFE